jgi:glucose-6-phosphate isomerase
MSESPLFTVSLDLAFGAALPRDAYDGALLQAQSQLKWLREQRASSALELLDLPRRRDDIDAAEVLVPRFRENTTDIVVLGIGGSSLGGRALAELRPPDSSPRIVFYDNPDPFSYAAALSRFDLRTTRFVAISKSGGTPETLAQVLAAADAIDKAGGGKYIEHHFIAVTEPKDNALRKFATGIGCPVLDHPEGIGGRYSVMTVVGMLPALLMGLNARAFREGAASVLDPILAGADSASSAEGAALNFAAMNRGLRETVLWCYADRLRLFGAWFRQLWAESLGKDGKGTSPVDTLGPVDQHSQLQLYLGGPNDKLYTIVTTDMKGEGPVIPRDRAVALGLGYIAGRPIGDLVDAEARATADTLARHQRPVRRIHAPMIDERSMGALFMHFMLETIIIGRLMRIDPFDQPAVEEGKVLARKYLEEDKG